jgi:hypothetical protein
MSELTIRQEIVNALCAGFGPGAIEDVEVEETQTFVHVKGFDRPITVFRDSIEVPTEYGAVVAGISLDIQAILSNLACLCQVTPGGHLVFNPYCPVHADNPEEART